MWRRTRRKERRSSRRRAAPLGGEEKLRAIKTLDVRGDFKRAAGQTTIDGELQVRLEAPDKLRRDEDLSLPGRRSGDHSHRSAERLRPSGRTSAGAAARSSVGSGAAIGGGGGGGDAVRRRTPAAGARPIDPAQLEEAQRRARQTELSRFMLVWLLTSDGAGVVDRHGGVAGRQGRRARDHAGRTDPPMRLFLDQTTHMPLMMTWQGAAPQLMRAARRSGRAVAAGGDGQRRDRRRASAQQATLQMTLGDYKTVNGIKLPHLITRGVNDMTIEEWTIESYRINPSFKADVFTK